MESFELACSVVEKPRPRAPDGASPGFWSEAPPSVVTNDKGEKELVRGGMTAPQAAWWNLPNFIKVFVGGYGAGKTLTVPGKRAIAAAIQNAPAPVAVVSPTFPLARQTTIPTIKELLSGKQTHYGRAFWWKYLKQSHEFLIRFRGRDARIIVNSGDDPLSLRGPNLGAAYIDEPFIQELEVFNQMVARVRHPMARRKEIGLSGTPEQLNWGYDLCVGKLKKRHDVGYVQASTRTNPVLDDGYVTRLLGAFDGKAADAYVDAAFVELGSGQVFYAFRQTEINVEPSNVVKLPVPEGAELGVGMDFNVNPMAAAVFWRAGSHIHFIEEIELPNADTEFMCDYLREHYVNEATRKLKKHTLRYVYPDASGNARKTSAAEGRTDFWYIRQAGFTVMAHAANPKVRDSVVAVNGKMRPKVGQPTWTCDPACESLIKYASTYTYEQSHKQQHMWHLLSAMRYPVAYLYPVVQVAQRIRVTGS